MRTAWRAALFLAMTRAGLLAYVGCGGARSMSNADDADADANGDAVSVPRRDASPSDAGLLEVDGDDDAPGILDGGGDASRVGRYVDVTASHHHACGMSANGTLTCWGLADIWT
jgi:hypothetical protein